MELLGTYIAASQSLILVIGGFVTLLALRAYRRTRSPALRALAAGLGLVTAGALLAGVLHWFTPMEITTAVAIHSTFTAAGFLVLAYSLYVDGEPRERIGT